LGIRRDNAELKDVVASLKEEFLRGRDIPGTDSSLIIWLTQDDGYPDRWSVTHMIKSGVTRKRGYDLKFKVLRRSVGKPSEPLVGISLSSVSLLLSSN
jgi:hypothetical protein